MKMNEKSTTLLKRFRILQSENMMYTFRNLKWSKHTSVKEKQMNWNACIEQMCTSLETWSI